MKIIKNVFLKKLIMALVVCILLINFTLPSNVYAWDLGGVLFKPITALTLLAIDSTNFLLSSLFLGINQFDDLFGDDNELVGHNLLMSPEMIFNGTVTALDANIFKANADNSYFISDLRTAATGTGSSVVGGLKRTVSGIYEILRNFCAIVMLCMLIYTGIRIVLSSASVTERKDWQMRLMDWVKSLLLLLFMHVIMIGIFYICDVIMDAMGSNTGANISTQLRQNAWDDWSLMGQLITLLMYGYTTYLTIVFAIAYFKRLMWVVILIVIAPVVAVLYCFGREGKRIFMTWFMEFTTAVLIQPYHYLIYYILISIPIKLVRGTDTGWLPDFHWDIAGDVFIYLYCLIAMSMIRPFEKFLRRLLGMDKGRVANQASFESGKQTLDVAKEFVKDVAKTIAAVYTGGASMQVTGAPGKSLQMAKQAGDSNMAAMGEGGQGGQGAAIGALAQAAEQMSEGDTNTYGEDGEDIFSYGTDLDGTTSYDYGTSSFGYGDPYFNAENNAYAIAEANAEGGNASLNGANSVVISGVGSVAIEGGNINANGLSGNTTASGEKEKTEAELTSGQEPIKTVSADKDEEKEGISDKEAEKLEQAGKGKFGQWLRTLGDDLASGTHDGMQQAGDFLKRRKLVSGTIDTYSRAKDKLNSGVQRIDENLQKTAFGNLLRGMAIRGVGMAKYVMTDEGKEKLATLRKSFHKFNDSMYMPGDASGDWKTNIDRFEANIKENAETRLNNFVNDEKNIKAIVDSRGLVDKHLGLNGDGNIKKAKADAEAEAKTILKEGADPYLKRGINDVGLIDQFLQIQKKTGAKPETIIEAHVKDKAVQANVRIENFNKNEAKVDATFSAMAKISGGDASAKPTEVQRQEVRQKVEPYVANGVSDPQTLARLTQLEDKIMGQLKGNNRNVNPQTIMGADRIIQEALKKGMNEVKVQGSKAQSAEMKTIMKELNAELGRRKKDITPQLGKGKKTTTTRQTKTKKNNPTN